MKLGTHKIGHVALKYLFEIIYLSVSQLLLFLKQNKKNSYQLGI